MSESALSQDLWKSVRLGLLAVTFVGAIAILGKAIATPPAPKDTTASAKATPLATTVPLTGWQPTGSEPIQPEPPKADAPVNRSEADFQVAQRYQYRQNQTKLDVELRYMLGDGNNSRFLFVYTPIRAANANLQQRTLQGVGSYGILAHQGRAYLSACVNPRGESTVTEQEFKQNSNQHDLKPDRVLPWIMGQAPLLDRRCLWTLMSVPLSDAPTPAELNDAFKTLETAWADWHQWWRSNYPAR